METCQSGCLAFFLLFFSVYAEGQILYPDVNSLGLGASVVAKSGIEGVFYNPAGLGQLGAVEFTGSLVFPYIGTGLKSFSSGFVAPLKKYVLGAGLEVLSDEIYQQSRVTAVISRHFELFNLGIRPEWRRELMGDTYSWSSFFITIGTQWYFGEKARVGFLIKKPITRPEVDPLLQAGLAWIFSEFLSGYIQWSKQLDYMATLSGGLCYTPAKRLAFSTGWRLKPARIFFGISYSLQSSRLDYALGLDPHLGIIQGAGLYWTKNKNP